MVIWIIFAIECLILAGLFYRVGRESAALLRQLRQTMKKIQPVIREAQELAVESAPVMQKTQALVAEVRELGQLARQTKTQVHESLLAVRQVGAIRDAFLRIRNLAPMLLRQDRPPNRMRAIAQKIAALVRPRRKRNPLRLLLPAGIGAFLGGAALLALKRFR